MGGAGGDLKTAEDGGRTREVEEKNVWRSVQVAESWLGRQLWEEVRRNNSVVEEEEQTPCELKWWDYATVKSR